MNQSAKSALLLGQKQKRLRYWHEMFQRVFVDGTDEFAAFHNALSTYSLLISKADKAENDSQRRESLERLSALDRQLVTLFEDARLMTSKSGKPSIQHMSDNWDK